MNPLYQMMMQQHNPMLNMAKQFQQFRQNFNGNPQQMVQQLLQSGKVTEIQYMDTLLHAKKNLLKSEEMMNDDSGYSNDSRYVRGYSRDYRARGRGRNARRDSQGRYADGGYSGDSMADQLRDMMDDAPDENTRKEFQRFIEKIERR